MEETRMVEIKQSVLAANDEKADGFRALLKQAGTLYTDIMASPGAGKTTLLLALIDTMRKRAQVVQAPEPKFGVIEADLESMVDAEKIKAASIPSVELNTHGVCHVEMGMVERSYEAFKQGGLTPFDYMFLENIGNLVCPAEFDTGAHNRVMLLSVPEGYDKVYKYPPMFAVVDALIVTKCDYLPLNPDFDMEALKKQASVLNPGIRIFVTSARTGEGMDELAAWFEELRANIVK
ncbi:MAG: hydrogenase nickel incorporation protein HypB [Coriobacteriales bacterium]|nr:hydrogenase nickel incorporation protein HypB [Coriobacteriales bacterium]